METAQWKMMVWGGTVKGMKVYPLTRSDANHVQRKFEEHLHTVMHRPNEVRDWG